MLREGDRVFVIIGGQPTKAVLIEKLFGDIFERWFVRLLDGSHVIAREDLISRDYS